MEETNDIISCIIPMYNVEKYIERCIESVLNQTYKNVEIIVVDDGSSDSSLENVKKMLPYHSNIKLVKKTNGGVSSARNAGIHEASGKYIFFLDSDDVLPPDSFSTLVNAAIEYNADLVIGRDLCFFEGDCLPKDSYSGAVSLWEGDTTLINALKDFSNTWNVCGKLFSCDLIRELNFVEGRGIGEDSYFFFLCALRQPRTVFLDRNVYFVSLRMGSATRSPTSKKKIEDMLYFIDCKKSYISKYFVQYIPLANNLEVKTHLAILSMLLNSNEYLEYEKMAIQTVREKKRYYISGQSNDRLFYVVVFHCYWLYKRIWQLLK